MFKHVHAFMSRFSDAVTRWTGSTSAFVLSVLLILGWLITGPIYAYSDTWQLVANTFTTLVEFMMVFVLQCSQNKDKEETHKKLDEILSRLEKLDEKQIHEVES